MKNRTPGKKIAGFAETEDKMESAGSAGSAGGDLNAGRMESLRTPAEELQADWADDPALCPLWEVPQWPDIVEEFQDVSPADFVLRFGGKKTWPVADLAEQLHCYPRAAVKLGPLHQPGMTYLREPLEQASGYAAAVFRAREWMKGLSYSDLNGPLVADITGGLGIDSAAWAMAGARVLYCERNRKLAQIARHNHRLPGLAGRITHVTGDGMEWLKARTRTGEPQPDLLYIDPSRRPGSRRVISLEDSEPAVLEFMPLIVSSAGQYLIKLSPMIDTTRLKRLLSGLQQLVAVSVAGEVKELLAGGSRGRSNQVVLKSVVLDKNGGEEFRITSESPAGSPVIRPAGTWLYEPDPAILKMGLTGRLANRFQLGFMNLTTGYLTGDTFIPDFPGRKYAIRESHLWKPKKLRRMAADRDLRNVHIHQRGFPLSVDQLYDKLDCRMGDQAHFIATPDDNGRYMLYVADLV